MGGISWHARLDFSISGILGFLDVLIEDVKIFISKKKKKSSKIHIKFYFYLTIGIPTSSH